LILSYNLLVALTLALNGFTAFLLFRRVAGTYWPGLVCGILFALSPYAFLKLEQGFLQKAILWWLPLFLLFLLRYLDDRRRRDAAAAGLFWLGALLTYAPYAWFAALAGLVMVACRALGDRLGMGWGRDEISAATHPAESSLLRGLWPLASLAVAGVIFLLVLLPGGGLQPPEGIIPVAVADAPIGSLDIFHAFRFFPYTGFRAPVEALPLGLSLSAAVFALVALLRRRPRAGSFLALVLVFLILALGPFLNRNGEIISRMPLPYYAISLFAPWGRRLGYSIRALPFLELALLALAALALSGWRSSSRTPNRASVTGLLLSLALLGFGVAERAWLLPELYPPVVTPAVISPDIAWLREHARVVLHLPFNVRGDEPHEYCYLTARSNTRMMNPYLDFRTEGFPLPPLPNPDPAAMADYLAGLHRAGITHLAVHLEALDRPARRWRDAAGRETIVENYTRSDAEVFRDWCGAPVYENPRRLLVYTVPDLAIIRRAFQARQKPTDLSREEQILLAEARRRGLDRQPDLARQVREFEDRLLMERLLEQEILPRVQLTESALRDYYDAHRAEFRRDPQIRVFHLLVPIPAHPTAAEWLNAFRRAEALLADLAGPVERVFELAETLSRTDPVGARWGDLGYLGPGRLPPAVDEELFSLREVGEVAMLESAEGFHLFRLMDRRPGRNFTFEEVREAVRERAERAALGREIARWTREATAGQAGPADDMVRLPGGSFWMGATPEEVDRATAMAQRFVGRTREVKREWFEDETLRFVTVAPFELDRREVTVAEYRTFLQATGRPTPPAWENGKPPPDDWPATGVTWDEATAYARWVGKRLPTAEEWEWAARGPDRRFFPWGDAEPDGTRANYADKRLAVPHNDPDHDDGFESLAPVGSFPAGATPEGILDQAGNAREWTASQALGIRDPADHHLWAWENRPDHLRGPDSRPELMRVVKGGSFDSAADDLRSADMRMLPPDTRHESVGFRCARDGFRVQEGH
jgi:formylglycine-generating enzyme required for sulfatase activity